MHRGLHLLLGGFALLGLAIALSPTLAEQDERFLLLQSTTSTQNTGLLDDLIARFKAKTGINVRVVAVGTGQALWNARNGDGDVLLVHARDREDAFLAAGYGIERRDVMYNDFVFVGPSADPAGIRGSKDAAAALRAVAAQTAAFASRGDDSGTHTKERELWADAGVDPSQASGSWYRETGTGMGATLNTAVAMQAYALTDRGTWISFRNKRDHEILVEGDPLLANPYGVMLVSPVRHPHVKQAEGRAFIRWLTGSAGQAAIAAFRIDGQQLFFPNAGGSPENPPTASRTRDR
ncbi:MAG: solute-binding protein [bacterium]|nr:solute-binding protein [bacterium]MCP5071268.1 solute-binding protein [bacterium]